MDMKVPPERFAYSVSEVDCVETAAEALAEADRPRLVFIALRKGLRRLSVGRFWILTRTRTG